MTNRRFNKAKREEGQTQNEQGQKINNLSNRLDIFQN